MNIIKLELINGKKNELQVLEKWFSAFNIVYDPSSHIVRLWVLIFDQNCTHITTLHSSSMMTMITKLVQYSDIFNNSQKFTIARSVHDFSYKNSISQNLYTEK